MAKMNVHCPYCRSIKKANQSENINRKLLKQLNPEKAAVQLACIKAAEADEMWAYVGNKNITD